MVVGVARGVERLQRECAEADRLAFADLQISTRRRALFGDRGERSACLPQPGGTGHVVGVDVGLDGVFEDQAELIEQRQVALDSFEHRIDQYRLARLIAPDQISVGRRHRIKQLTKDHSKSSCPKTAS